MPERFSLDKVYLEEEAEYLEASRTYASEAGLLADEFEDEVERCAVLIVSTRRDAPQLVPLNRFLSAPSPPISSTSSPLRSCFWHVQRATDLAGQHVWDFWVAGNSLDVPGPGVTSEFMFLALPFEEATVPP